MDMARETAKEREGGPTSVRNVLSVSGAGGITFWGIDLVFLEVMSRKLDEVHVVFLRQMAGKKAKRQRSRTWKSEAVVKVLKEAGTQTIGMYIDKRQATVSEWVALIPILEILDRETGYEGGGRRRDLWWWQTAAWKQLSATLRYILVSASARRWEYVRRGEGRGDKEVTESDEGSDGPQYAAMDTCDTWVGK